MCSSPVFGNRNTIFMKSGKGFWQRTILKLSVKLRNMVDDSYHFCILIIDYDTLCLGMKFIPWILIIIWNWSDQTTNYKKR